MVPLKCRSVMRAKSIDLKHSTFICLFIYLCIRVNFIWAKYSETYMGICLNICVYMCLYVCTHMYIHVCRHRHTGKALSWFHPVADVTGATKVQSILKSGLDSLRPVQYAWRGQVSPAGGNI